VIALLVVPVILFRRYSRNQRSAQENTQTGDAEEVDKGKGV
jgi:hypothetical protein